MSRLHVALLFCLSFCVGCGGGGAGAAGTGPNPPPLAPPQSAQLTIDAASSVAPVSRDVLGASLATWSDVTQPQIASAIASTGVGLVRWPGGSESDSYHWQNGGSVCNGQGYVYPASTFDAFMTDDVRPNNLDVAVTVNYGSNQTCNGGGDPAEAAAWVA
jgi:hypothetical protein